MSALHATPLATTPMNTTPSTGDSITAPAAPATPMPAPKTNAKKNHAPARKKPKAAAKPTLTREPRSAISELDVDERRAFEEWKQKNERDQSAWEHQTKEELELEFLEKLNDKSKKGHKKGKSGGHHGLCPDPKPKIDLEALAEKVVQRLILEARLEHGRAGCEPRAQR